MKTGFKDPAAIKKQDPQDRPKDGKNSPWDFRCPQYDERTSCFINAGTHYGVGHRQPTGKESASDMTKGPIPFGRKTTLKVDEIG